ncbi:MAG TPA: enoyl-CoA hydratase [Hyphomicrobiaceae bacterium]|nr:enoyl-CoA hydratase [Hyphomicrobiaceae bacterium]
MIKLSTDKMLAEKDGPIGWMIFNNPARRNAVSHEMRLAVMEILDDFSQDDSIRVIVMKGAGDKAFVSGADISQFEGTRVTPQDRKHYGAISRKVQERYATLEKPLIAMIQGFCLGGGLRTALNADIRIASHDAQFGVPAGRLGIAYDFDSVRKLVEAVGQSRAKEILLTARRYGAEEALRMGLVNQVVPRAELESTVRRTALTIAENAPLSARAAKVVVAEIAKDPQERDLGRCAEAIEACFASQDYAEGRRAFMAKRKPVFTGR